MKVYEFKVDYSKTTTLVISNEFEELSSHSIHTDFEGQTLAQSWQPVKMETLRLNMVNDCPHLVNGKPIISDKVMKILKPYTSFEAEFLPLIHDELDICLVNVLNILDCVDWRRSKVKWFKEKYFIRFDKLVFDFANIPANTYMFKIKELAATRVYVTESFKKLIEKHQVQGLDFSIVYDSEFTPEKEEEQARNYKEALDSIERNKGREFSYEEARTLMEHGKAVASGKWQMQLDEQGELWLGELMPDLIYEWGIPVYLPPILLGYQWHEVERYQIHSKGMEE